MDATGRFGEILQGCLAGCYSVASGAGAMPVGQEAPQFVSNGVLSLTPVPPMPQ